MKTEISARPAMRLLTMTVVACTLASCKLPPRYAMREIQNKGLFTYLGTDYSHGYSYSSSGAHASSAPFQLQRPYAEPRAIQQIPYRSTYHTNRHMRADYDRVPYRPKTVTRSSPARSSNRVSKPSSSAGATDAGPTVAATPSTPPNKSVTEAPQPGTAGPAPAPKPAEENLPFGTPVAGRPGMVVSPYTDASKKQLVDVTGLPPGEKVKDPYSGKLFRVPPPAQAENKTKSAPPEAPAKPESGADKDKAQPTQN